MRRVLSGLLLSAVVLALPLVHQGPELPRVGAWAAGAQTEDDIYYTFYGQRVPLTLRQDQVAVVLDPQISAAQGGGTAFQRLQRDLSGQGSRSGTNAPLDVTVRPLGDRYAVVQLAESTPALTAAVQERLQQPYVQDTLPVLSRAGEDDTIVLPNQIIVSFEPGTPQSRVQLILNRHGLELLRPLRFTEGRYLVRSRQGSGLGVLNLANRLNSSTGVQSATPNFVQTVSYRSVPEDFGALAWGDSGEDVDSWLGRLSGDKGQDWPGTDLYPLHWHLDSRAFRGDRQPRTDIHAPQAWAQGSRGEGVVVAVIDSLIQWDHPDLANSLYTVPETQANRLPGEVHGWDFSSGEITCKDDICAIGDPDTRISRDEMNQMRDDFQASFTLSPPELLQRYGRLAERIQEQEPELSPRQVANIIRRYIQRQIMGEFHGTWSSGVIAAQPCCDRSAIGVAPAAEILPVRVFGLGGEITIAALVEAIGYAAERGADAINLSLGGLLPDRELTDQVMAVLDAHPNLVIVASAGNESLDGVAFPAAIPGVLSVGATTLEGKRTAYSSYGGGLDVVAPGGDIRQVPMFGILTTGGTWVPEFWQGLEPPENPWALGLDPLGSYVQVQGTSFSAPATAGVAALVLAANGDLSRDQVSDIIESTASYEALALTQSEANQYRLQAEVGLNTLRDSQILRPTGIFKFPQPISPERYYFGSGLVNAAEAVEKAQQMP